MQQTATYTINNDTPTALQYKYKREKDNQQILPSYFYVSFMYCLVIIYSNVRPNGRFRAYTNQGIEFCTRVSSSCFRLVRANKFVGQMARVFGAVRSGQKRMRV